MTLKQRGQTETNGLNYFDICSNDFKRQFGYIAKKDGDWKLYININGEKKYFKGKLYECIKMAEELYKSTF